MGSKLCWTANNHVIGKGDVGTVVGFLHGQGKVQVKFRSATEYFDPDQLIPLEAWKKQAVRNSFIENK